MQIESRGKALMDGSYNRDRIIEIFDNQMRKLVEPIVDHTIESQNCEPTQNSCNVLLKMY